MNQRKKWDTETWLLLLLGILVLATVILQIVFSGETQTRLEATLFSILQFLFSMAFAWLLSRLSFRKEFQESQKHFAIAAYRRICEIDMAASRFTTRIAARLPDASSELRNELHVLQAIAVGMRQTAKSSIADWADIIGDEIATMDKIEELKGEQELLSTEDRHLATPPSLAEAEGLSKKLATLEKQVETLSSALPAPLKVIAKRESSELSGVDRFRGACERQLKQFGWLELRGLWEPDGGFERNISELVVGDRLNAKIGDVESRVGAMVFYDSSGHSVGSGYNTSGGYYEDFVYGLIRAIGKSEFTVSIVTIKPPGESRTYFVVRLDKSECVSHVASSTETFHAP